jgi:hypothetical protein
MRIDSDSRSRRRSRKEDKRDGEEFFRQKFLLNPG